MPGCSYALVSVVLLAQAYPTMINCIEGCSPRDRDNPFNAGKLPTFDLSLLN